MSIGGIVARWPGDITQKLHILLRAIGDAISRVPLLRWDAATVCDFLTQAQNSSVQHGGFVQGAECFANAMFDISMDLQQRVLLEASYPMSIDIRPAALKGGDSGVYLGIMNVGYAMATALSQSAFAATSGSISVAGGRISFSLGLQEPCVSLDTACSSALAACHAAVLGLPHQVHACALVVSVSLILMPTSSVQYALAIRLAPDGRCKTFDARANGYVRSEGVCSHALRWSAIAWAEMTKRLSVAVQQDGRSASLTAPNGSAQCALLVRVLSWVTLAPSQVANIEAHGTGIALGDPTEVGALGVLTCRATPLVAGSAKASMGHTEAAAGHLGLHEALCSMLRVHAVAGNTQLRAPNPRVRHQLNLRPEASIMLPEQALRSEEHAPCGVSSFGCSSTIAHAALQLLSDAPLCSQATAPRSSAVSYQRRLFAWSKPIHPLLQRDLSSTTDFAAFRSPIAGTIHALVADHVVQGRVVFSGAANLETARAGCCACVGASTEGAQLRGVFFLQPLVLELTAATAAVLLDCSRQAGSGAFEVCSGVVEGAQLQGVVTHCTGEVQTPAVTWSLVTSGLEVARGSGALAVNVSAQYQSFDATGLQYGPGYRLLLHVWASNEGLLASLHGKLERTPGVEVHLAELDGALQLTVSMDSGDGSETRLPFAVDDALLQDGATDPCSVSWASLRHCATTSHVPISRVNSHHHPPHPPPTTHHLPSITNHPLPMHPPLVIRPQCTTSMACCPASLAMPSRPLLLTGWTSCRSRSPSKRCGWRSGFVVEAHLVPPIT